MLNSPVNSSLGGYKLTTVNGKIAYYKESEGADSAVPFKSVENIDFPTLTTKANTYFFYNAGHKFVDYTLKYNADHSSVTIYANTEPSLTNATRIAGTSYDLVSQTISNTFEIENYKFIIVIGAQYFGYDHSSYATLSFRN